MTEAEFDLLLGAILERPVERMMDDELAKRISVTQAATDRLLYELERWGLLSTPAGVPVLPFLVPASRFVETILTRE